MKDPLSTDPHVDRRYEHDCPHCTFLGQFEEFDLYYCMQAMRLPTVIARRSSDGPDYVSGFSFVSHIPALQEAYNRAEAAGLEVCT